MGSIQRLLTWPACILGAGIICVDVVVRRFPRMEGFSITESDGFLSASLSLSFGVMVWLLPESDSESCY